MWYTFFRGGITRLLADRFGKIMVSNAVKNKVLNDFDICIQRKCKFFRKRLLSL